MPDEPQGTPDAPQEGTPKSNWYDDINPPEDRLATYQRFKSREDFHNSWFEKEKKISQSIVPPDPSDPEFVSKVRQNRLKLGAKANADEYTVTIPEDLEGVIDKETVTKTFTERAAKFGVTQAELDEEVKTSFEEFRKKHQAQQEAEAAAEREKAEAIAKTEETLSQIWGARKDSQMANAVAMAKHYDDGLFADENQQISEEVRAEKGGLLVQRLKAANDPVLYRLFAVMHSKELAEGSPPMGGRPASTPQTNVQMDRYEHAKKTWPKRGHEYWDRYSKEKR